MSLAHVFAGPGTIGGQGGGPGTAYINNALMKIASSPNDGGGGGGPGVSSSIMIGGDAGGGLVVSDEEMFADRLRDGIARFEQMKFEAEVVKLQDAVDVRLSDDEVLDVEQLQERFGSEVVKVGNELRISHKIPVVDFQNGAGEIIQVQKMRK